MLSAIEAIELRRSIRRFREDPIPQEAILQLLEAARLAPSGSNRQPWRFLVVTDPEERRLLREACLGQAFIEQAPVAFLCCADLTAYSRASRSARMQEFEASGVLETLSGRFAGPGYRERVLNEPDPDRETLIKAAVANVYIAIEHMALAATALGLGSCWVGGMGEKGQISQLFHLPEHIVPVAVLPVGYPATVPPPRPRLPLDQILLRPLA